jgi:iron-sulfur cluster assembly protein
MPGYRRADRQARCPTAAGRRCRCAIPNDNAITPAEENQPMITVTATAAEQIRSAATAADADGLPLRIAARRDADGSLDYAMGFDNARATDLVLAADGVDLVVAEAQRELLDGMTLDYVEFEPGDFRFIFINPNDVPAPQSGGCGGGCSCGGR